MASLAFTAPLLPGGTKRLRDLSSTLAGSRLAESDDLHRRLGISVERWYLQTTPKCDVVIVYLEARDIERALTALAASRAPFDLWFKTRAREAHGIDFNRPPQAPLPVQVYQWCTDDKGDG